MSKRMSSSLAQRVRDAAKHYNYRGTISSGMLHLIEEEGFKPAVYKDDVGVPTVGVGATAENMGANFFTETYPKYVARAQRTVKGYSQLPEKVQNAVLSALYRGDIGPKTL